MKKLKSVFLLFFVFNSIIIFAQPSRARFSTESGKNFMYATAGYAPFPVFTVSMNYERLLSNENSRTVFLFKTELGGLLGSDIENALHVGPQMTLLLGKGPDKIEASLGGSLFTVFDYGSMFVPTGAIGYRYQKKGRKSIFRFGVGWPDAIYISGGFRF